MKLYIGCEIKRTNFSDTELTECRFNDTDIPRPITRSHQTLYQLVYQDGGVSIHKAAKTIPFEVIFDGLRTAFLGIQIMRQRGVIHTDIKPDNICYSDQTNKSALIDFGNCTKLNDTKFISAWDSYYNHKFMYWPSEFNAMATQTSKIRNAQYINLRATNPIIQLLAHKPTLSNIRRKISQLHKLFDAEPPYTYNFRRLNAHQRLPATLTQMIAVYHEHLEKQTIASWLSVDMYGLGASIIQVLAISYVNNPNMITATNQGFYVDVVDLCMQMMATDPTKRLEPFDAIQKHELIVARRTSRKSKRKTIT